MRQIKGVFQYFTESAGRFCNGFLILFTLIGCADNTANGNKGADKLADSAAKITISNDKTQRTDTIIPSLDLTKDTSFEILSTKYELSADSIDNEFYKKCKGWSLSVDQIKKIIPRLEPIDAHELNYLYSVTPCEMKGKIKIGVQEYDYLINAGSFMKIYNRDTTYIFACRDKRCAKFFLTGEDVPE